MRFLVHSEDCDYNETKKEFFFDLAKRFDNPTQFRLIGATFEASTAESYPISVYLRSDAIRRLSSKAHTTELQKRATTVHETNSNVLGILRPGFENNVYHLTTPFVFPMHAGTTEICVDFQFSNNRTPLNGIYVPPLVQGVTDTMMEAHATANNILVWIDMAKNGTVLDFSNNQSVLDGVVGKIISRVPGGSLQLSAAGGSAQNAVKYVAIGECRGIAQAGATNAYVVGSYAGNPDLGAGHHFLLFQSLNNANGFDVCGNPGLSTRLCTAGQFSLRIGQMHISTLELLCLIARITCSNLNTPRALLDKHK